MKPSVLAIGQEDNGILFHRIWTPLRHLERNGYIDLKMLENWSEVSDDVDLGGGKMQRTIKKSELQGVTHFIFSRHPRLPAHAMLGVLNVIRGMGIKIIVDVDDWWHLPRTHRNYDKFYGYQVDKMTEACLKFADEVWCTQKFLAKKVKRFNKKIRLVPNAVDLSQEQWQNHDNPDREVTFGYLGASGHEYDIASAGINLEGVPHKISEDHLLPEMMRAKNFFTWQKPSEYGNLYRDIDVSLVPLNSSEFGKCKSNIKLIEAAFTNTAVIVSPVFPYAPHLDDGLNCLVAKTPDEWNSAIDKLANDKELTYLLARELRVTMQGYTMDKINEIRLNSLR